MMLPIVNEVAKDAGEDFVVIKVDIDKSPELAAKYSVMSVPTFIVFLNGKETSRMQGAQTKEALVASIKEK